MDSSGRELSVRYSTYCRQGNSSYVENGGRTHIPPLPFAKDSTGGNAITVEKSPLLSFTAVKTCNCLHQLKREYSVFHEAGITVLDFDSRSSNCDVAASEVV